MSAIKTFFTDFLPNATSHLAKSYQEIVSQGIDDRKYEPVYPSHFVPCTQFEKITIKEDHWIQDSINEDNYLDQPESTTRLKCLALTGATPFVHLIGVVLSIINRMAKIITLAHFWYPIEADYPLSERTWTFVKDVARVALAPALFALLEVSALWGLIFPNNGRKLYATFERCLYGKELLAPCFQPEPRSHLGGQSLSDQNAW